MKLPIHTLLLACAIISPVSSSVPWSKSVNSAPIAASCEPDNRGLLTQLRDRIVESIWQIPGKECKKGQELVSPGTRALRARYGNDIVIRFTISSIEEARALAEAVNVLFLDVWEFTTEWVDIRIAKDVVRMEKSRARPD